MAGSAWAVHPALRASKRSSNTVQSWGRGPQTMFAVVGRGGTVQKKWPQQVVWKAVGGCSPPAFLWALRGSLSWMLSLRLSAGIGLR
eukprot:4003652-Pyramimonas_sp.AAC.1